MFDLCTGDSLETALAKMGFENAEQIAAAALQMDSESDAVLFHRGYSGEELEALPAGTKCYDFMALEVQTDSGSEEQFLTLDIKPYYKTENGGVEEGHSSLQLSFNAPDFGLWGLHMINK